MTNLEDLMLRRPQSAILSDYLFVDHQRLDAYHDELARQGRLTAQFNFPIGVTVTVDPKAAANRHTKISRLLRHLRNNEDHYRHDFVFETCYACKVLIPQGSLGATRRTTLWVCEAIRRVDEVGLFLLEDYRGEEVEVGRTSDPLTAFTAWQKVEELIFEETGVRFSSLSLRKIMSDDNAISDLQQNAGVTIAEPRTISTLYRIRAQGGVASHGFIRDYVGTYGYPIFIASAAKTGFPIQLLPSLPRPVKQHMFSTTETASESELLGQPESRAVSRMRRQESRLARSLWRVVSMERMLEYNKRHQDAPIKPMLLAAVPWLLFGLGLAVGVGIVLLLL